MWLYMKSKSGKMKTTAVITRKCHRLEIMYNFCMSVSTDKETIQNLLSCSPFFFGVFFTLPSARPLNSFTHKNDKTARTLNSDARQ
jgi:hypothetical protein